ncbi:MAG: putative 2-aminoethylphosphonate ABC transporter ATP-binding protein [Parvibaculaceae bacterium]
MTITSQGPAMNHQPARAQAGKPTVAEPYLSIRDVTKRFDNFTALNKVNLDIHKGEFVSFLGPSGCGKTTLLRCISGLDIQTTGTIRQGGKDISLLPVTSRDFGIVFQSYALFPNLPIGSNVAYGLTSTGRPRAEIAERVKELLALVGLSDQIDKYPAQLSGGQQQRVALARALALSPGLLLLDEPLSALDARVRARLRGEIRDVQKRLGLTTIMVTHDQEEALTMSDRIVVMSKGNIEQVGTPGEIYAKPASPFVADFVGRMNFVDGTLAGEHSVNVKGAKLDFIQPTGFGAGGPVTVCIRPEDIAVRGFKEKAGNLLKMRVGVMEFVGSHFTTVLHAEGTNLNITADLSMNDVRDLDIASGKTIVVQLPPKRLRVFPQRPDPN